MYALIRLLRILFFLNESVGNTPRVAIVRASSLVESE